jgi:hypothetical protein
MFGSTDPGTDVPVACSLTATDLDLRTERWRRLGSRTGVRATRTADGLLLVFESAPGVESELTELARLERECCAFAKWDVENGGAQILLRITAQDEMGIQAVHDMRDGFAAVLARP